MMTHAHTQYKIISAGVNLIQSSISSIPHAPSKTDSIVLRVGILLIDTVYIVEYSVEINVYTPICVPCIAISERE